MAPRDLSWARAGKVDRGVEDRSARLELKGEPQGNARDLSAPFQALPTASNKPAA